MWEHEEELFVSSVPMICYGKKVQMLNRINNLQKWSQSSQVLGFLDLTWNLKIVALDLTWGLEKRWLVPTSAIWLQ